MAAAEEVRDDQRRRMVVDVRNGLERLVADGVIATVDERVLAALADVPRHHFVPDDQSGSAYRNRPLPIGWGQTISQPFIVALMTQLLRLTPQSRVLEVGTGSGYQAAVLARLAGHVYSIEIVAPLAERAAAALAGLGARNVTTRTGDGYRGWPEAAPFDAVIVTAAPEHVPPALVEQLKPGGRMVIPVGTLDQELVVIDKAPDGTVRHSTIVPVRFVPLTGDGGVPR